MEMTDEEIGFLDLTTEKSDNFFQWALEDFNVIGSYFRHVSRTRQKALRIVKCTLLGTDCWQAS